MDSFFPIWLIYISIGKKSYIQNERKIYVLDIVIIVSIPIIVGLVSHFPIQSKRPTITSVKEWKQHCLNKNQQTIYHSLTARGYYVSCHIQEQNKFIPLALEPFRIALFERKNNQFLNTFRSIYFSLIGWKIVFFSKQVTEIELLKIISNIEALHEREHNHFKHVH